MSVQGTVELKLLFPIFNCAPDRRLYEEFEANLYANGQG